MQNVMQGNYGSGDERSFLSMKTALTHPCNAGFLRSGAKLTVILLTDEDDYSHPGQAMLDPGDARLTPVEEYVAFLDELTGSRAERRAYSVNTISINTPACAQELNSRTIGVRVGKLADLTGGVRGNLCGDFAEELGSIFDHAFKR